MVSVGRRRGRVVRAHEDLGLEVTRRTRLSIIGSGWFGGSGSGGLGGGGTESDDEYGAGRRDRDGAARSRSPTGSTTPRTRSPPWSRREPPARAARWCSLRLATCSGRCFSARRWRTPSPASSPSRRTRSSRSLAPRSRARWPGTASPGGAACRRVRDTRCSAGSSVPRSRRAALTR